MNVELCRVLTNDGYFLDGALTLPEKASQSLPVEAFLLVHGTGSNFYTPGVLESFARQAACRGAAALRINTRGHDGIASIPGPQGSIHGGAAYEVVSECRHDLRAWLDFLTERGYTRIALTGHSMGGVKSIYTQAHDPQPSVKFVIGISPPRFCHANFMRHRRAEEFRAHYREAERLVDAGKAEELLHVTQPMPLAITAGGFLAKYGPHDDYDTHRCLPKLACPLHIIIGTKSVDTSPAFDGQPEAIKRIAAECSQVSVETVPGANTPYSGCPEVPFERAAQWLENFAG